jgi:hypothetical protein
MQRHCKSFVEKLLQCSFHHRAAFTCVSWLASMYPARPKWHHCSRPLHQVYEDGWLYTSRIWQALSNCSLRCIAAKNSIDKVMLYAYVPSVLLYSIRLYLLCPTIFTHPKVSYVLSLERFNTHSLRYLIRRLSARLHMLLISSPNYCNGIT